MLKSRVPHPARQGWESRTNRLLRNVSRPLCVEGVTNPITRPDSDKLPPMGEAKNDWQRLVTGRCRFFARRTRTMAHLLTQPYTVEQLIQSDKATELHIDNIPLADIIANITQYLIPGLNEVKALLGYDLEHSSGYRCSALNVAVGGSKTSAHMQGYAEDFWCPAFGTPLEVVRALTTSGLKFDQLIYEHTWVHVSFDPRLRQMIETAHFSPGGPTYSAGA